MTKHTLEESETVQEKKKLCETGMTWENLLGVALLGAIGSSFLYYLYDKLSEETKHMIRENIINFVKQQLAQLKK